ncbi:MAG: hypothetical protein QGI68_04455 [Pseudomonadales bacterium]|nr:hypothetical protein [Pseudomonadales bacterium]HJN49870.1 hypothetical protein [Pseudomonadales bacterium]
MIPTGLILFGFYLTGERGLLSLTLASDLLPEQQQADNNGDSEITGFSGDRIHPEFTELPRTPLPPKTL